MTRIPIGDPDDPRIAVFVGLRDHVARQLREQPGGDMAGSFIAEGDLVIDRALIARYQLRSVLISSDRVRPLPTAIPDDIPVYAAGDPVLEAITGRAELRDPLACFARPPLPTATELVEQHSTFAVLEGVNNPNNLGVIVRNAAGLGIGAVLLDPTCGDPLYRRAIRASMGQVFALPHARIDSLPGGLDPLHAAGVHTIALTPTAHEPIQRPADAPRVAILLGAEGPGLTEATQRAATHRMGIAMANDVDSLNVASAAAIAFHALRDT